MRRKKERWGSLDYDQEKDKKMPDKMRVQELDPNKIKIPEVRINSAFDEDIFAMFKEDLKKTGINQPLLVAKQGTDMYVIDGMHRLDEAKLQGMKTVPAVVVEMTLKDMQLRNLVLNRLRGKTKASEEVMVIKDLYENHKCGIEEITEKTGMKRDRVEMLIQISGVDDEVWKALDNDEIKVCHAFEISRLVERSTQLRILRVVQQYKMPCKELKGVVDDTLHVIAQREKENTGKTMVEPPRIPTAECSICHGVFPVKELASVILCRNCYSVAVLSWEEAKKEYVKEEEEKASIAEEVAGGGASAGQGL